MLFLLFLSSNAKAQNLPLPKKVFKHNYANETFGKTKDRNESGKKTHAEKNREAVKNTNTDMGFVEGDTLVKDIPEEPEDLSYENESGSRVVWIGAILQGSAGDKRNINHLKEKLEELTAQAIKHDYMIGPVFIIGNADVESVSPYLRKLQFRQALVEFREDIPAKYQKVKMSPAWIVQTEKGQIILEATGPLRRHINKNGELIVMSQN